MKKQNSKKTNDLPSETLKELRYNKNQKKLDKDLRLYVDLSKDCRKQPATKPYLKQLAKRLKIPILDDYNKKELKQ